MSSIKKLITTVIMTTSIFGISTIPVQAEWKQDTKGYWYSDGNSWVTGWKQVNNKWFYFESTTGYMKVDGWLNYNGQWYYLKPTGEMANNETYRGCNFEPNGTWNQNYNVNSNNTTTNTNTTSTNSSVNNTATSNSNNSSNSNVSNTFDNSTNNSGNTTLSNTGSIIYNDNSKTTNNVDVKIDNTSKEEKKYYKNQDNAMKTYYEKELKQAKADLDEAKTCLNNIKFQKTVSVAKQQADGTFKYEGEVDTEKVSQAEKSVQNAEDNVEFYEKLLKQYS